MPFLFLLTPPRGGRPLHSCRKPLPSAYFYSRPAWGATPSREHLPHQHPISTHAPAWGATWRCCGTASNTIFLLTPPRGGRHLLHPLGADAQHISTHAPAWGATFPGCPDSPPDTHFYSRPRVRGDRAGGLRRPGKPISTHAPE